MGARWWLERGPTPDYVSREIVMHSMGRQKGVVIVTVAFALLFLLGFMAIALDFGHLFVVKTELQTATDSCALAAAQELDGASDALLRATNAGKTAGNLNKVNFQGAAAGIVDADVTFSNSLIGTYDHNFAPVVNAKYAKCVRTKGGMAPWLMQMMGAFTGNASYKANQSVSALGVATRTSAQSACAIPVAIRPKTGGTAPNYGYAPGEWIPSLYNEGGGGSAANDLAPGHFGWANLDGSNSASEAKTELLANGHCNLRTGDTIGSPGAMVGLRTAWNSRFGLYVNGAGNPKIDTPPPNSTPPDTTGYAYTAVNWSRVDASGNRCCASDKLAPGNFFEKRADFRSYGDTTDTVNAGDTITGLSLPGSYTDSNMGTHAAGTHALATFGGDRRLVLAPIVTGTTLTAWACVLMLHPMDGPNVTVHLEFVGNAASASSPCASAGLAGGPSGPLVPALVQ